MFEESFAFTAEQEELRAEVRRTLHAENVRRDLAELRAELPWRHAEAAYRALGEARLLAVDWPEEHGGRGASIVESAIVAEEMALSGVPDSVRINTIDNAGATLLAAGTARQRAEHLAAMARGVRGCLVLYSEPHAGSDLGDLRTRAERVDGGWRLTGEKVWNIGAPVSELGVCAARTGGGGNRYSGITLFLVPLTGPDTRVSDLPGINPELFNRIEFDGQFIDGDAVIGEVGGGWPLINDALALERTGIYFYGRAQRWADLLGLFDLRGRDGEELDGIRAELPVARLVAWKCIHLLAQGEDAAAAAAAAKWWCSELALRVAKLAWRAGGYRHASPPGDFGLPSAEIELTAAIREAVGLTLSGGTSEMMLSTVYPAVLDGAA